ncbi:MAG: hypothetical protein A2675_00250 [Candidatus Yonathbacteria bacterium RIFCSPHIGHO2_01_FULL_51_10]|uniref:Uncharacterized protein n=1 Tax=Candidatus Yonathbacteria bacterium RIFCSPHIGHO2_01_FULL_51_10 TaxID=1802723 RepID=A0A1G2S5D8_9BACT|nr:MAG: hypothetical protein A2675_00250 [Candidatus Yonathbacteria bacterium RIFCSPHIGHO2_01_FULL_51_10]
MLKLGKVGIKNPAPKRRVFGLPTGQAGAGPGFFDARERATARSQPYAFIHPRRKRTGYPERLQ